MPNPYAIFLKAVLFFAAAVLLVQLARQVGTVEVTVFADGTMSSSAVGADDPIYRDELDRARARATWVHVLAGCSALIGVFMVRKGLRVHRKRRTA